METIVHIITIIILIIFISSFLEAKNNPSKHINIYKYITLQDNENKIKNENTKKPKHTNEYINNIKKEELEKQEQEKKLILSLKKDCDLAMKSLGTDSKQRKYLLQKIFSTHKPKTVQEFITLAYTNTNEYIKTIY